MQRLFSLFFMCSLGFVFSPNAHSEIELSENAYLKNEEIAYQKATACLRGPKPQEGEENAEACPSEGLIQLYAEDVEEICSLEANLQNEVCKAFSRGEDTIPLGNQVFNISKQKTFPLEVKIKWSPAPVGEKVIAFAQKGIFEIGLSIADKPEQVKQQEEYIWGLRDQQLAAAGQPPVQRNPGIKIGDSEIRVEPYLFVLISENGLPDEIIDFKFSIKKPDVSEPVEPTGKKKKKKKKKKKPQILWESFSYNTKYVFGGSVRFGFDLPLEKWNKLKASKGFKVVIVEKTPEGANRFLEAIFEPEGLAEGMDRVLFQLFQKKTVTDEP